MAPTLALFAGSLAAADVRDAARAAAPKLERAVVRISVDAVLVVSGPTPDAKREFPHRAETNGTVVDPSGLTLASASALDPALLAARLLPAPKDGKPGFTTSGKLTGLKLILGGGEIVEAELVLADAALDVAIVRPRKRAAALAAATIAPVRSQAPALLEELFTLSRLGPEAGHATRVSLRTIESVVGDGRERCYVCNDSTAISELGAVAWDARGAPVGLFVLKAVERIDGDVGAFSVLGAGGMQRAFAVLRPIEHVLPLIERARKEPPR